MCESDEDLTTVKLLAESRPTSCNRHNIPDIPYNKDYHLFVCYTEYNAADVRDIVECLEDEGLKCCYHERDFQPGQNILKNINSAIKRSMGIIVVLSEEFVNSGFCQHEIEQALHASITHGYVIIPIKTEPCIVPEVLQSLTYIDAQYRDISEMHVLILNAFLQKVWHVEHNKTNGLTYRLPLTSYKEGFKWLTISRYKLLIDQRRRQSIWRDGLSVSDTTFREIETIVSNSFHVKYKHIITCLTRYTTLVFFMLSLLNVGLSFLYIALTFGREMDESRWLNTNYFIVSSILSIIIIWIFCLIVDGSGKLFRFKKWKGLTYSLEEKSKEQLNKTLWHKINKETIRADHYFVAFLDDLLLIVRFDIKPCEDMFVRRCQHLEALTRNKTPGESDIEFAERTLESYLEAHYIMLTVPSNVYCRHEMTNRASCLCSLLENNILKSGAVDDVELIS